MANQISDLLNQINSVCRDKGGKYANYSCKTVSWDDANRGTVGGGLSCWGSNITDTYLNAKDGRRLFTVRPDNWNEKLGYVSAKDLAIISGNQNEGDKTLKPMTLENFLINAAKYGKYANLDSDLGENGLLHDKLDQKISVRFQTTFLPVGDEELANLEFCTEAYNYNTRSDDDPRNLILLVTTQGLALQQDGRGTKKIFHHNVNNGKIDRHWLEAEKSKHKVGGTQVETAEEKADAIKRGKATSSVIGIKAMGTRFNVLMTIQIPLEQKPKPVRNGPPPPSGVVNNFYMTAVKQSHSIHKGAMPPPPPPACGVVYKSAAFDSFCASESESMDGGDYELFDDISESMPTKCMVKSAPMFRKEVKKRVGTANAARVSQGSKHDTWKGLTKTDPKRNNQEHITATIVIYNTIAGGVPSETDIMAAIDDMEQLYASCHDSGFLAEDKFDFMKDELTVKNVIDIKKKIEEQPAGSKLGGEDRKSVV